MPIYARNVRNFLSIVLRVLIAPVVLLGHQLDRLPVTAMWAATIAGQALYDGRPSLGLRLAALWSSLMDYRSSHWLHVGLGRIYISVVHSLFVILLVYSNARNSSAENFMVAGGYGIVIAALLAWNVVSLWSRDVSAYFNRV